MTRSRCALAVCLLAVLPALLANAPAPPRLEVPAPPPVDFKVPAHLPVRGQRLVIVPSSNQEARLILPRDLLARHKAEPRQEGAAPIGQSLPPIVAGLGLAVGVVLAGLLLVRRASPRLVTGGVACVLAGLLFVNSSCSPPPRPDWRDREYNHDLTRDRGSSSPYRAITPLTVNSAGQVQGEVLLEEGTREGEVRLIANQEALAELGKKQAERK